MPLSIQPGWAWKSLDAARLLLASAGAGRGGVQIRLNSNVPVARGCGSSTADVVSTLRALRAHLRIPLDEAGIARLAVQAKSASDGSALPVPVIFRHCEGVVEETFPGGFPEFHVVVADTQPGRKVETLTLPRPRYSGPDLTRFEELRKRLRLAFLDADPAGIGEVGTASARLNQDYLPKPQLEGVITLVEQEGGYGVVAAHSGTVLALLFPVAGTSEREARVAAGLTGLGMPILCEFTL